VVEPKASGSIVARLRVLQAASSAIDSSVATGRRRIRDGHFIERLTALRCLEFLR
jgi:hypothetical protein